MKIRNMFVNIRVMKAISLRLEYLFAIESKVKLTKEIMNIMRQIEPRRIRLFRLPVLNLLLLK